MALINTRMVSGENYSIAELFSGNKKIVIPDLQRDYCWGDKAHGNNKKNQVELVSGFVDSLIEMSNATDAGKEDQLLGLLYAYEHPVNHIQLCDGQQRLTTLYLLLGVLNQQTGQAFRKYLIKDEYKAGKEEIEDDDSLSEAEPFLQYAIRESTLYFLDDLVNKYFIRDNNHKAVEIKKQVWYFAEYDADPSIQSIISALAIIEGKLKEINDYLAFGEFISSKLKFLYYDMGSRLNGEETFVVINTTGEPLTATENLKPALIGGIKDVREREGYSKIWEEWETFFWRNRIKIESTADLGLNEFLTWFLKIKTKTEDIKSLKGINSSDLGSLEIYFQSFKELLMLVKESEKIRLVLNSVSRNTLDITSDKSIIKYLRDFPKTEKQEQQKILLPLLHFMTIVSQGENDVYQFLRRLRKNYYDSIRNGRKGNYVDWRYIIEIINTCVAKGLKNLTNILTFNELESIKKIQDIQVRVWYNDEEVIKDKLKETDREILEEWEDHTHFMGDLTPLLKVTNRKNGYQLDVEKVFCVKELQLYFVTYCQFISIKQQPSNNLLKNQYYLFRLCCDYDSNDFYTSEYGWFRCIQENRKDLHTKDWFFPIWEQLLEGNWGALLENINRNIFIYTIYNKDLNDSVLFKNDLLNTSKKTIDKFSFEEFENERLKDWGSYSHALSIIFVLMYFEVSLNKEKRLNVPQDLKQIGFRLFNESVSEDLRFRFGNITLAFHKAGSKYIYPDYFELMKKIETIRKKENRTEGQIIEVCSFFDTFIKSSSLLESIVEEIESTQEIG
ncbi:DUF262 domain-containing protein [Rufibacter sp. LB8]|uniref:DUF262 domain-containing protein n=1 Tax=Rufibacter sp. LB8 TaxID=2777781 RepID=UPI00178C2EAB|nr:DUF262 domain-containing protein [Rufibacter sp. LB8]